MDEERFSIWLNGLLEDGRLEPAGRDDLLEQRRALEEVRSELIGRAPVAGFFRGELYLATTPQILFSQTIERSDGLLYYEQLPPLTQDGTDPLLGVS